MVTVLDYPSEMAEALGAFCTVGEA